MSGQAPDIPDLLAGRASVRDQAELERIHESVVRRMGFGNDDRQTNGETEVIALLRDRGAVFVADVGANLGAYSSLLLERLGGNVHVHAFEPSPRAYAELEARYATNPNVETHPYGLGDTEGEVPLYADRAGSPLASVYPRELTRLGIEMAERERVTIRRLDALFPELGIPRIDLLKVDAEGHDLAVLRGAGRLLDGSTVGMIQFEHGGTAPDARIFLRDYFDLLTPAYELYRVLPDGLWPLGEYRDHDEISLYANYVALPAGMRPGSGPWSG